MPTYVNPKVRADGIPIIMKEIETMHQPPGHTLSPPLYVKFPKNPFASDLRGGLCGALVY